MNPFSGADRLRRARQERKAMAVDYLRATRAEAIRSRARLMGWQPDERGVVCGECGALVYEKTWHREWHRDLEGQR